MPGVNPGPSTTTTVNTQTPYGFAYTIQTIAVSLTPVAVLTITAPEQSFGLNGVTQVTAATGILADDIILGINPPSVTAGVAMASWRVDGAVNDKFYIQWVNPTAGSLTPVAGIYLITVARYNQSTLGSGNPALYPSTVQP